MYIDWPPCHCLHAISNSLFLMRLRVNVAEWWILQPHFVTTSFLDHSQKLFLTFQSLWTKYHNAKTRNRIQTNVILPIRINPRPQNTNPMLRPRHRRRNRPSHTQSEQRMGPPSLSTWVLGGSLHYLRANLRQDVAAMVWRGGLLLSATGHGTWTFCCWCWGGVQGDLLVEVSEAGWAGI